MKINIELNDNSPLYDVLDSVVLGYLKNSLDTIITKYASTHPDDIKSDEEVSNALNVLIEYYGG
jgi:hypothetical protein